MQLQHEFTLPIPPDEAWSALLDVERVAPCMPGASLDHVDGDDFSGRVNLKAGPLRLTYCGDARITEKDEDARRMVIAASGREARGSGTAEATVTACLESAGDGTRVTLLTDLDLTGRPAQFGRGLVAEVAGTIIGQFADRLSLEILSGGSRDGELAEPLEEAASSETPGPSRSVGSGQRTSPQDAGRANANDAAGSSLDVLSLMRATLGTRGLFTVAGVGSVLLAFLLGRRTRSASGTPETQFVPWPTVVLVKTERG